MKSNCKKGENSVFDYRGKNIIIISRKLNYMERYMKAGYQDSLPKRITLEDVISGNKNQQENSEEHENE